MRMNPILVVDDDDALREALVAALEVLPVEITVAAGGKEAVEMVSERRFAVLVTDLVMKDVDGFAVLKAAKESYPNCCLCAQSEKTKGIPYGSRPRDDPKRPDCDCKCHSLPIH